MDDGYRLSTRKNNLLENHTAKKDSLKSELAKEKDACALAAKETADTLAAGKEQDEQRKRNDADLINTEKIMNKHIENYIEKVKRKRDYDKNIADFKNKTIETDQKIKGLMENIDFELWTSV